MERGRVHPVDLSVEAPLPAYDGGPGGAPPSYQSIVEKIHEANETSSTPVHFLYRVTKILLNTAAVTAVLFLLLAVPVAMIVMGALYKDDCPVEPNIPIYLIVTASFSILKCLVDMILRCIKLHQKGDSNEQKSTTVMIFSFVILCFLSVFFIVVMAFKAAIFDVGGVLKENPDAYLKQYSEKNGLPSMFMREVFHKGSPNNAFSKMESGEYTFSQGIGELQRDFEKAAKEKNVKLPKSFNIEKIMMDLLKLPIYKEMINAIIGLKNNGLKVGVLTNTFVYDLPLLDDEDPVRRTVSMKLIFDQIIKSCHVGMRKPDPEIYKLACREMGVEPKEVIFVDDLESNVNGAKAVGMTTVLFTDVKSTLTRLQELTDVNVFEKAKPISVDPEKIAHGYATSEDGVKLHYVEMGEGPAVILCHGFPESWYSWRKQIPALVLAGYRVIVPDQRGFGLSSAPMEIKDYTHDHLCKDIKDIMDSLNIPRATVVGHDWGGVVVWLMALRYPSRVRAVVGVNTPYFPPDPRVNRWDRIREDPGVLDYQLYFQEPGVAEAELEKDLEKTFKYFFRTSSKRDYYPGMEKCTVANVRQRGGLLVGVPDNLPLPSLLTEKDLAYYVKQYKTSGFRGPLNWYRNHDQNWKNSVKDVGRKIYAPSLMVTAGKDRVLPPELSKPMEEWVPNLSRVNIEDCGHWTQMERPNELNEGLIKWLNDVHKKANIPVLPRF